MEFSITVQIPPKTLTTTGFSDNNIAKFSDIQRTANKLILKLKNMKQESIPVGCVLPTCQP